MKLWTFVCLIPLILFQAAGYRRPLGWGPGFGLGFGSGLGVLYSVTTISGPPLALMLSNEGYAKHEFRAALGLVRLAESSMTAAAYLAAGMFSTTSLGLSPANPSEPGSRRPSRRLPVPPREDRDVPTPLYELRCVGCGVWSRVSAPRDGRDQ